MIFKFNMIFKILILNKVFAREIQRHEMITQLPAMIFNQYNFGF